MKDFEISPGEWDIASNFLKDLEEGAIYPPHSEEPTSDETNSVNPSFIKIAGCVYAFFEQNLATQDKHTLFHATDRLGTQVLIKSFCSSQGYYEAKILTDLSTNAIVAPTPYKVDTIVMPFLGETLQTFLRPRIASLDARVEIAIHLCWQVHRLHSGKASRTGERYAHLDLNSWNVLIDAKCQVKLVGYSAAQREPELEVGKKIKSVFNNPYLPAEQCTRAQADILALKRLLFMPFELHCSGGHKKQVMFSGIFLQAELEHMGLFAAIDTGVNATHSASKDKATALKLCALLIRQRLGLKLEDNNSDMDLSIVEMYFSNRTRWIPRLIAEPQQARLVAALARAGALSELQRFKMDPMFLDCLNQSTTTDSDRALICLNQLDLADRYNDVLGSRMTAANVCELRREGLGVKVEALLKSDTLNNAVHILRVKRYEYFSSVNSMGFIPHPEAAFYPCEMHDYYKRVIKDRELASLISRCNLLLPNASALFFLQLVKNAILIKKGDKKANLSLNEEIHLLLDMGIKMPSLFEGITIYNRGSGLSIAQLGVVLESTPNLIGHINEGKHTPKHYVNLLQTIHFLNKKNLGEFIPVLFTFPACVKPMCEFLDDNADNIHINKVKSFMSLIGVAPENQRLQFIKKLADRENLRDIYQQKNWEWRALKKLLAPDEIKVLQRLTFNDIELRAKAQIHSLKHEITNTMWSRDGGGRTTFFKGYSYFLPEFVGEQAAIITSVINRERSYSEAIDRIKKIGKSEAQNRSGVGSEIKHTVLGVAKSNVQEFAEKFASDETFDQHFGPKSSGFH